MENTAFDSQEYIWACTLTKETPTFLWQQEEDEDERDFLIHTLFLKHAVLGVGCVQGERNVVEVTTRNYHDEPLKVPFVSLTLGQSESAFLDLCFAQTCPATFTLIEGSGPITIIGQESTEFPQSALKADESQDEEEDIDEDEVAELCTEGEDEAAVNTKTTEVSKKRKSATVTNGKAKRSKLDNVTEDSDEDMESEEEEEEAEAEDISDEEEDDDSEYDPTPEKKKKPTKKQVNEKVSKNAKPVKGSKTTYALNATKKTKKAKK